MVDAQTLTTMFGGIGVGVAAFYYVMTLREQRRNRKVSCTNEAQKHFLTPEWMKNWFEVINMEWSDYDVRESKPVGDSASAEGGVPVMHVGLMNQEAHLFRGG